MINSVGTVVMLYWQKKTQKKKNVEKNNIRLKKYV